MSLGRVPFRVMALGPKSFSRLIEFKLKDYPYKNYFLSTIENNSSSPTHGTSRFGKYLLYVIVCNREFLHLKKLL